MATRVGNWKIKFTVSTGEAYAAVECPSCRQSMQTTDPREKFRHCGIVDCLTHEQQDILLGRSAPGDATPAEVIAAQNMQAAEVARNVAKPVYWDSKKAAEAEVAGMQRDALEAATHKIACEDYHYRVGTPSQPRPQTQEPYDPFTKNT